MTTYEAPAERAEALAESEAIVQIERCPTCGAAVPAGFRFCGQCGRALAAALAPSPGDVVTILFTDLESFTAFASRAEQSVVRDLILTYHALVRDQMSRHRGFEVKQTGDGFMIAFSSAARAVLCAVDIQRARETQETYSAVRELRICAGINSGEAIREGGDFFGHTVNVASRIAGRATGGQVLVSEATRVLAGHVDGVRFVDFGRRRLRGVRRRQRFYEVIW